MHDVNSLIQDVFKMSALLKLPFSYSLFETVDHIAVSIVH